MRVDTSGSTTAFRMFNATSLHTLQKRVGDEKAINYKNTMYDLPR